MKKFIIALALLATGFAANAQIYSYQSLTLPATLAAGTTNLATTSTIGALKQQNLALSATISATATTTNIYTFNRSVDGVNYDTNAVNLVYFVASTTGTPNTTTTNMNMTGYGFLKLVTVQTIGGTVTNTAMSYGIKIQAP